MIEWLSDMDTGALWALLASVCAAVMAVGLLTIRSVYFREDPLAGGHRRPRGELESWMREPSGEQAIVGGDPVTTILPVDRIGLSSTRGEVDPRPVDAKHRAPAPDEPTRKLRPQPWEVR